MNHKMILSKFWFAAVALLVLPLGSAKAQLYDTFEVLRLQDRTIYIFPKGYAPNLATPFAPVAYPWFNPWYGQPTVAAPMVAAPDAVLVDSSAQTLEEVVDSLVRQVDARRKASGAASDREQT